MSTFILSLFNKDEYDMWFTGYTYGCNHPLTGKSLKQWCEEEKADLCFNHTWFNMPTATNKKNKCEYNTVCDLVGKGKRIGYGGIYERIEIDSKNITGGCYLGIKDNVLKNNDTTTSRPRNGFGKTKDGQFFIAQSSKMTNKAFCQKVITEIKKYKTTVEMFIIQDGGGSVGMYSAKSKLLWAPEKEGKDGRYVANVFCVKRKINPCINRTLKKGCKGDDVKLLQKTLGGLEIDGSYGPACVARVKEAQKALGLTVDGSCGPATQKALGLRPDKGELNIMMYGCLPAKKDVRDYKITAAHAQVEYPEEFVLKNLPKIKNQGSVNSCCAHATSSILEYHNKGQATMSTNFIYGIQKKLCGHKEMGMYMVDACKIITKYGDPVEKDCPGNIEIPKCYEIAENTFKNKEIMTAAYEFRTDSYYLCQTDNDIKYALMNFGPVLGAINWREKYTLNPDNVIVFDKRSEGGGHAVMICGWNKTGWIIQNSWGKNWGDNGRFILPFSYGLLEARALIDHENSNDSTLRRPKNNKVLNIFYKIANFFLNLFRKEK